MLLYILRCTYVGNPKHTHRGEKKKEKEIGEDVLMKICERISTLCVCCLII